MTVWLYQMNASKSLEDDSFYTPDDYQADIESQEYLEWLTREVRPKELEPKAGDTILYWFVAAGTDRPGLYGLGIVFGCYEDPAGDTDYKYIKHLPVYPSEILSVNPIYDDEAQEIMNEIRGTQKAFATMFAVDDNFTQRVFAQLETNGL